MKQKTQTQCTSFLKENMNAKSYHKTQTQNANGAKLSRGKNRKNLESI
jgi:hypothetical protein